MVISEYIQTKDKMEKQGKPNCWVMASGNTATRALIKAYICIMPSAWAVLSRSRLPIHCLLYHLVDFSVCDTLMLLLCFAILPIQLPVTQPCLSSLDSFLNSWSMSLHSVSVLPLHKFERDLDGIRTRTRQMVLKACFCIFCLRR